MDEGCSSVCRQRRRVEDTADVCEVFLIQARIALAESSRVDHDLGSCETQRVSRRIGRGGRKAKHLRRRSKRGESKRRGRRVTWLRRFLVHLGEGCKLAVPRQQMYRCCRSAERAGSLLGTGISSSFNSSQAPTHTSRHLTVTELRQDPRLTIDRSSASIKEH